MNDRSSARHGQGPRTVGLLSVRKIVHLRWKQRLGPVPIGAKLGVPSSTVHAVLVRCRLNRLTHIDRVTGEPARRYERAPPGRTDPRGRDQVRQHPRRRRMAVRRQSPPETTTGRRPAPGTGITAPKKSPFHTTKYSIAPTIGACQFQRARFHTTR